MAAWKRELPGFLPGPVVGGGGHHSPVLAEEQAPVARGAEGLDVLPEDPHELGRDRHPPDVLRGPVLETAVVVALPGVGPLLADAGPGPVQEGGPPAGFGKGEIRLGQTDHFGRPEASEVHPGEESHQAPAAARR